MGGELLEWTEGLEWWSEAVKVVDLVVDVCY